MAKVTGLQGLWYIENGTGDLVLSTATSHRETIKQPFIKGAGMFFRWSTIEPTQDPGDGTDLVWTDVDANLAYLKDGTHWPDGEPRGCLIGMMPGRFAPNWVYALTGMGPYKAYQDFASGLSFAAAGTLGAIIPTSTTTDGSQAATGNITVAATANYPASGIIQIEDERIQYTSVDATHFLGCTRGAEQTTAATHATATAVHCCTVSVSDGDFGSLTSTTSAATRGIIMLIGTEQIFCRMPAQCDITQTFGNGAQTLTVDRGIRGTTIATHANGAAITAKTGFRTILPWAYSEVAALRAAMKNTWRWMASKYDADPYVLGIHASQTATKFEETLPLINDVGDSWAAGNTWTSAGATYGFTQAKHLQAIKDAIDDAALYVIQTPIWVTTNFMNFLADGSDTAGQYTATSNITTGAAVSDYVVANWVGRAWVGWTGTDNKDALIENQLSEDIHATAREGAIIWLEVGTVDNAMSATAPMDAVYTTPSVAAAETDGEVADYPGTVDALDTSSSLVAYYRMGEASGNLTDTAGVAGTATVTGSPTYAATDAKPTYTDGDTNAAVGFDGSVTATVADDYFTTANLNGTAADTGEVFTISAWIYPTAALTQMTICSRGTNGYDFQINSAGKLNISKVGGASNGTGKTVLSINTRYRVAAVKTGAGAAIKFYVNGVLENPNAEDTLGTVISSGSGALTIGARGSDKKIPMVGQIDELVVFNRALSADEIAALHGAATYTDATAQANKKGGLITSADATSFTVTNGGTCWSSTTDTTTPGTFIDVAVTAGAAGASTATVSEHTATRDAENRSNGGVATVGAWTGGTPAAGSPYHFGTAFEVIPVSAVGAGILFGGLRNSGTGTSTSGNPFSNIKFAFSQVGIGGVVVWEYYVYDATLARGVWKPLSIISDGTVDSSGYPITNLARDGTVHWELPTDWVSSNTVTAATATKVNGRITFWVRARCTEAYTTAPTAWEACANNYLTTVDKAAHKGGGRVAMLRMGSGDPQRWSTTDPLPDQNWNPIAYQGTPWYAYEISPPAGGGGSSRAHDRRRRR